ncbi:MAG: 3'-5' exonuclease, partial [Saprospiraceae bacterium]|nr:3'-5' exonuclease [Saprospiraceae bacterium]
ENSEKYYYIIIDTETNGLPKDSSKNYKEVKNWPSLLQIGWSIADVSRNLVKRELFIINQANIDYDSNACKIHGISKEKSELLGHDLLYVLNYLLEDLEGCKTIICHNYSFDINVILAECTRAGIDTFLIENKNYICTMDSTKDLCNLSTFDNKIKYPTLQELFYFLFKKRLPKLHNAGYDSIATLICFNKLRENYRLKNLENGGALFYESDLPTSGRI